MGTGWDNRGFYGRILKKLIIDQKRAYFKEKNKAKKSKTSKDIAYLIQVQSQLIKDERNIEKRIERLEELAGIAKRGVITP